MAVEDRLQHMSPEELDRVDEAHGDAPIDSELESLFDGFRLVEGESMVETLESDGLDRFVLTDRRVIYIGGDEDHRNWSFASISEITSVEVTRVARERSTLIWGVLGLIAAVGIWQVATNDTVGIIGAIVMATLGAVLLWDFYLRTPPSRLLFRADGKDIGGPLNRSAEVAARSFGDSMFRLKSGKPRDVNPSKPAGITRRYRFPGP